MDDLASASVSIEPDLSGFKEKLDASLRSDTAGAGGNVQVDVGVNDAAVRAALEGDKAEMDQFSLKHSTATVDVNDSGVKEKIDKDDVYLDLFGLKRETAHIDVKEDFTSSDWDRLWSSLEKSGIDADIFTDKMSAAGVSTERLTKSARDAGIPLDDMVREISAASSQGVDARSVIDGLSSGFMHLGEYTDATKSHLQDVQDQINGVGTDSERATLGLYDVADNLAKVGLAAKNAGGDFVETNGQLTTASKVVKDLGITLDGGAVSVTGYKDALQRFSTDGLGQFKTAADGGTRASDGMNAAIRTLSSDGVASASEGFRKLFGDSSNYVSGMRAVDDANKALDAGFKAAGIGGAQVAQGFAAMSGDVVAINDLLSATGKGAASAGGGLAGLGTTLSELSFSDIPVTGAAIALLVTALIPVAAVATGVGIALTGAFAAAGLASGAFLLAASNDMGQLKATLSGALTEWQAQLDGIIKPTVNAMSSLIAPALNDMAPLVAAGAESIKSAVTSIGAALNSGGLKDFIAWLSLEAPAAITTFTTVFENMGSGFAGVFEAFTPFIATVENGLISLSTQFENLGHSAGLASFVNYIQQEAPVVGAFFEQLIPTALKLVAAFAPAGDALLRIFTPVLQGLGNLAPIIAIAAKAFDLLAIGVADVLGPLVKLNAAIVGPVIGAFSSLASTVGGWLGISKPASASTTELQAALERAGLSAKVATEFIGKYGSTSVSSAGAAAAAQDLLAKRYGISAGEMSALEGQSNKTNSSVQQSATQLASAGATIGKALQTAATSAQITTSAMAELEIASGKTGTAIASAMNSAGTATQSAFASATSVVSAFSGQVGVTQASVQLFYGSAVSGAQAFANNIQAAIKEGYDPTLIEQILQAGPAKASGLLGELVQDGTTTYVAQIKSAQQALNQIGQEAVQEARLTQQAIISGTSQMADNLTTAMGIQQQRSVEGTHATVASIAAAMGQGIPQVAAVAGIYGEAIPGAMTASQGKAYLAAIAAGQSVTQALMTATGDTKLQAAIAAGALPAALAAQQGNTSTAAAAQAQALALAQYSQLAATAAAATQQAIQLPTAVNQQTAAAAQNALAQAQTVPNAQIGQLAATAVAAEQQAMALPTAVNIRTADAAAAALNQAIGVAGGINQGAPQATGAASGLSFGVFHNLFIPDTTGIGSGAGQGIVNGLNAKVQAGIDAASALAHGILGVLDFVFKPGSPSKVTTIMGQQIGQGIAVGIESTVPDVLAAAHSVSSAAIAGLSGSTSPPSIRATLGQSAAVQRSSAPILFQPQVTITVQGNLDNVTLPQVREEITGSFTDFIGEFERDLVAMAPV